MPSSESRRDRILYPGVAGVDASSLPNATAPEAHAMTEAGFHAAVVGSGKFVAVDGNLSALPGCDGCACCGVRRRRDRRGRQLGVFVRCPDPASHYHGGVDVPTILYGTAWKQDATEACVAAALAAGFRGFDTANQRKHYHEAGVGQGFADFSRDRLFIQTKFTFVDGQDHRLPYDPEARVADQVAQSYTSSVEHLGKVDSYVLHGPSQHEGLGAADREAWRAMESLGVRYLGVSNVTARQLAELVDLAETTPAFVQNRCYADRGWDRAVRDVCRANDITYQGFSLLTANRHAVARPAMRELAIRHGKTTAQIVFRFAQQIGILPLTGTRDPQHMREDLALDFTLDDSELAIVLG
jgi:diketogulonate reductase-like aldo/keto reductase